MTRATDPTLPITTYDPLYDGAGTWLVPGNWTRGKAFAWVAGETGRRFTELRARRSYWRWVQFGNSLYDAPSWQFDDGILKPCERAHEDAERYWEVS